MKDHLHHQTGTAPSLISAFASAASASPRFVLLTLLLASPSLAADSTHELRDSLLARGDFNGDGRPDVALVDRATGLLRIAHSAADGSLTWSEAHHTGIAPATGVATGRMLHASRDALAVTGSWANRTNLFDLSNPSALPAPLSVFTTSTGPTGVSAAQVLTGTALEEIVIHHTENGAPPQARAFVRFSGSPPAPQTFNPAAGLTVPDFELRPRRLEGLASIGSFTGTAPNEGFRIYRVGAAPLQVIASLNGLPAGSHFVHADFDGAATTSPAQFIFYNRDASTLRRTSLSAANAFSAIASSSTGDNIEHVTAVAAAGGGWNLLVVFTSGWAQLFSFDGQSAPVAGESFPSPADGLYQGVFAAGPGDFHLLAGPAGLPPLRAHRFTWNGSAHAPNGISNLPPLRATRSASNIFAFDKDPFIATDAVLLGSFSAGEWTRNGVLSGGAIQAQQARFSSPANGLGAFQPVTLGSGFAPGTHVLTNQIPSGQAGVPSYASAYGPTPALGRTAGEITIDPAPGRHLRAVRPRFTIPAGLNVFWRIGGGAWISLPAQSPGWQFDAFTIEWFGRNAAGITTPIRSAGYTFAEGPGTLDSDGDGVPDYVEIALGLDPLSSGDDADGDGASDLLEILSGTDPTNPASFPTRTNGPAGSAPEFDSNYQNTFNFRITPISVAGTTRYATSSASAAGLALHDLTGLQLHYTQTVSSNPQHARIGRIQAGYGGSLLVAATDANFNLVTAGPLLRRRGRELAGLIPVPHSDLGPVPHEYTGGSLPSAASAWITAARAHHSQPQAPILHTIDTATSLSLLLLELKYEQILRARGELGPAQTLSLTPFRPTETTLSLAERPGAPANAAFRLAAEDLDRLRRYAGSPPAFTYATGWLPGDIHQAIAAGLADPTPGAAALLQVAREIYFLSAAANDQALPQYPSPIDALRRFLRTARLPGDLNENGVHDPGETSSYWGNTTLTPAQLTQAHNAIPSLLALPPSRPTVSGVFVVDANTFDGPVPVVRSLPALAPHVLLQGNGEPWPLAQFAPLTTGAELTVTGFSDVDSPHAPDAIEVITLSLTKLPSTGPADLNNNLLGDDWENLFPGAGDEGPFGDSDNDGFSDFQEYLEGSDPIDPASVPPGSPVALAIPTLHISPAPVPGQFQIAFQFPAAFAGKIAFHVQQAGDLSGFADTGLEVPHLGSGQYQVTLHPGAAQANFWRIRLSLK